ncbi:hypothetical protein HMPREF9946_02596 [Acetobacteraceae bacterium AT-5844]|nr:hypothetical protein HMPREF9946_02596 [Acetobacteraceae bacterium AT-5844]
MACRGMATSQTMRLVRVPTSMDLLVHLRREMQYFGGLSAWARRNGISKGAVGNVEACSRDMTDGVAEKLGFARITHLWRSLYQRGSA